ncbi:uncharacterized protein LOC110278447 [Arachis duranensis]|uniref:Uncharacterized protein LOC110278447 n=1 Tax=Arachis duranensis TaxID=130453 RepID=A0A6P5N693_ARADU|nr:uncharacterized protein LOC110278447 [Arachis duranensis]
MNFIKKCWDEIGADFTAAVLGFFQSSRLQADANVTWVALAPKFTGVKKIKDLYPISMMGCVYKWIKLKKKQAAIIKLDFQKAYDRVKWSFVDIVLQKMGFGRRWRSWVKECVSMCFMMIGEAVRNGRISPLLVGRDHIELSHLQFTDDSILFCPSEEETIKNYRRLLHCFELMSGLSINFDKSSLISINCEEQWVQWMCSVLACKAATLPVKYLGISLEANPRLVKTWKPIIDKVEDKLSL